MVTKAEAKAQYEKDLSAGYSRAQAKERLTHLSETGVALPDPTEKYWNSLIGQESGGRQSAVSPKGATGIAQVMPGTAPEAAALAGLPNDQVALKNDPAYNARLGRAYLRKQFEDFNGDPSKALAAYNAGPGAVRKSGGDLSKLPAETRNYVPSIMNKADGAMQPELDSPEDIAAAQQALMPRKEQARQAYMHVLEQGGSREQAKAAMAQFAIQPDAPVAQSAPPVAPTAQPQQQEAPRQEPTFAQGIQQDIEKIYPSNPAIAGQGRALMGMIQGARKLYNQGIGDTAKVDELNADEQKSRDFWNKVEPRGSGISEADIGALTGNAAVGAVLPATKAGALGSILGGLGQGALLGAVQPTTADESQGRNAAAGGAIGGALGAIGPAIRGVVGSPDAERKAAAMALRDAGVKVPVGQEYNSPMLSALRKVGGESGSGTAMDKSLTEALAARIGLPGKDITNDALEAQLSDKGQQIGALFKNDTASPDREFFKKILETGRRYQMSGPVSGSDSTMRQINDLADMARPGNNISGELYQARRTGLTGGSVTGNAAEKEANTSMRSALDDLFNQQNPKPNAAELRSQYRLAKVLRQGGGIPADGITAKQLRNKLEAAANKGGLDSDVRELADQAAKLIPKSRVGGDAVVGAGLDSAMHGLDRPTILSMLSALTRGVAGPISKLADKGHLQSFTNNPIVQTTLANLLRGTAIPMAATLQQGDN